MVVKNKQDRREKYKGDKVLYNDPPLPCLTWGKTYIKWKSSDKRTISFNPAKITK